MVDGVYSMKIIILFKHMLTSCIQSMYILNSKFILQTKDLFFNIKLYICCLSYKKEDRHHKAVVSQYHASSEVVTLYISLAYFNVCRKIASH